MRRALAAVCVTIVVVVLLARYDTTPPRTVNPARATATPEALARAAKPTPTPHPDAVSADGPPYQTPFSTIQVRATLLRGKLVGVETIALSGDGPHTNALNARAEPILRAAALKAGSADIDTVSGATSTSMLWIESLEGAIEEARLK